MRKLSQMGQVEFIFPHGYLNIRRAFLAMSWPLSDAELVKTLMIYTCVTYDTSQQPHMWWEQCKQLLLVADHQKSHYTPGSEELSHPSGKDKSWSHPKITQKDL